MASKNTPMTIKIDVQKQGAIKREDIQNIDDMAAHGTKIALSPKFKKAIMATCAKELKAKAEYIEQKIKDPANTNISDPTKDGIVSLFQSTEPSTTVRSALRDAERKLEKSLTAAYEKANKSTQSKASPANTETKEEFCKTATGAIKTDINEEWSPNLKKGKRYFKRPARQVPSGYVYDPGAAIYEYFKK